MPQWLFTGMLFFALTVTGPVGAEFYRYTDEDGRVHFVDDMAKIPGSRKDGLKTYRERYDHLPAAERRRVRERQAMSDAALEKANRERLIQVMEITRKEREAYVSGKRPPGKETPFILKNNQILVPVRIGCGSSDLETMLLLDTGAGITALHRGTASGLDLRGAEKAKVRIAGGKIIDTRLARLDYIQVGPHRIDGFDAVILDFEGEAGDHNGLLGMDFLGRFPYGIDMANRVIRWAPE